MFSVGVILGGEVVKISYPLKDLELNAFTVAQNALRKDNSASSKTFSRKVIERGDLAGPLLVYCHKQNLKNIHLKARLRHRFLAAPSPRGQSKQCGNRSRRAHRASGSAVLDAKG